MKWRARVRRIILWSAASISVLLAVAWIGSGWRTLALYMPRIGVVAFKSGRMDLGRYPNGAPGVAEPVFRVFKGTRQIRWWYSWNDKREGIDIGIPLWAPLGISAALTAIAWRKETLARRRAKHNQCPACGYDQSGLAPNTPCPECNASPATPANERPAPISRNV